MKQISLLKNEHKPYGGELLKTRKGRSTPRPLDTKNTIHLVLRSSLAKGSWSFKKPQNEVKIKKIISKFSQKYGVKVLSLANVGNHLHFQIKLNNRYGYFAFIRAITGAIAMAVTGANRWTAKAATDNVTINTTSVNQRRPLSLKFWDYRPFTRVIKNFKEFLNLRDYMHINQIEGYGVFKNEARYILANLNAKVNTG